MSHKFCIAPMIDVTNRHCRFFFRKFSRHARLYTEMIVADSIIYGDKEFLLGFDQIEHPLALQLAGSDPLVLSQAALIGEGYGYDENDYGQVATPETNSANTATAKPGTKKTGNRIVYVATFKASNPNQNDTAVTEAGIFNRRNRDDNSATIDTSSRINNYLRHLKLNNSNNYYKLAINLCKIINNIQVPTSKKGEFLFKDILEKNVIWVKGNHDNNFKYINIKIGGG